jgi:predicted permease
VALWSFLSRPKRLHLDDHDFQEEVRAHLRMAIQEKIEDGVDPEEARYAALREFGNVTKMTEATRDVWTPGWLESLRNLIGDAQYAIRTLARHRLFVATVTIVLSVGIGVNAAVFTMLKGILIAPIAGVDGSSELRVIFGETDTGRPLRLSYPDFQYLRDHQSAFQNLIGSVVARANIGRGRAARQVWAEIVTGNYFDVLGVTAQHGRTLQPSDEAESTAVVVIGNGLWRRDYAADPTIVGRTISVNNQVLTVVGIADQAFHGTTVVYDVDLYIPVTVAPQLGFTFGSQQTAPSAILSDRGTTFFYPEGYLRPGTTFAEATEQISALWATRQRDMGDAGVLQRLRVVHFWQTPSGAPSFLLPTLGVLTTMGVLVLLIACANVAGLVAVHGVARRGEIALRLALGASRARVVRLLMIETLVLAIPGAIFGIFLAQLWIPRLVDYAEWLAAPDKLFFNIEIDGLVVGFAALVACVCALVFGVIPALQSARVDLVSIINEDASPRGAVRSRFRTGLVVTQVAISLMLLVGAGVVWRNVDAARRSDPGFDAQDVVSVLIDVRHNGHGESHGRVFYRKLLEAARADAASESVGLAANHLLNFQETRALPVNVEGYQRKADEDLAFLSNVVTPGYFRTLRIGRLAGRDFDDHDTAASAPVAIINATFARRFFGDATRAVGKRFSLPDGGWRTVIGVVHDAKYTRIDEAPRPYFYLPFEQSYRPGMILYARASSTTVDGLIARAQAWVSGIDPELPVLSARPLSERLRGTFIFFDLAVTMLLVFGLCGLGLVATGTYGLVSYAVAQSTHEIGIRLSLGATPSSIVGQFVKRGFRLGVVGAGLGLIAAVLVARIIGSVLFGVNTIDPISFVFALVVVLTGVAAATFVPAWRASRTDPLSALRHQ